MPGSIADEARRFALQNAVQFGGEANEKAVAGKVIATFKGKASPQEIIAVVRAVVAAVNAMDPDDQRRELEATAPELLQKEKKARDFTLPPLPQGQKGSVVTRFPPEPNGYLHIGHAKAAIIDREYASMYEGTFILRFDDTNPENALAEFYEAQKEDLRWLGVSWEREYNTSDNLPKHYALAEQLISQGDAYICTCGPETIKDGRFKGLVCPCRSRADESLDLFRGLQSGSVEAGILRLKGDMRSANTAMRDPTLFRVIEAPHPRTGTRYRLWPTYDFAGAVEDSISGVTHPFRTKEYELRDEVYFYILTVLGLRQPHLMEFARLSIEGMPVSKRRIKPLIEQGLVSGFDDVRLPTLRGLKRRGIVPEAIRQFVLSQGISKVESTVDFSQVEAANRKVLDPRAKRFHFVPCPVRLTVPDAPAKAKVLKLHPTAAIGERTVRTASVFFVPADDLAALQPGDLFRLKDLFNVRLVQNAQEATGSFAGDDVVADAPKIQWTTQECFPLRITVPRLPFTGEVFNPDSLGEISGVAEQAVASLPDGEIVQFPRVGFVRLERRDTVLSGILTHP